MPQPSAPSPAPRRRILASYSRDAEQASAWLREALDVLARSAADALELAGVDVVFVDAGRTTAAPADLAGSVDGVLILGGGDLDPAAYGQPVLAGKLYGVDPRADAFELALANAALDAGTPFLGICRGMQVLNVARGGTLEQDLGPDTVHNVESENSTMTGHSVRLLPDTLLGSIYAAEHLDIRSGHHQAVAAVGRGLRISADAADGTSEAIEGSEPGAGWVLGVQWHPEDPEADPGQLAALMTAFARAVSRVA
jgi:putative glutamine amidotransferase